MLVIEKIIPISNLKAKLFAKNLREGTKKQDTAILKGLYAQLYGFIFKNKNSGYLETSLLHRSIKKILVEKNDLVEFLPESQTQVCTRLGPKNYVMGYVMGHN